jgi:hypothetical protein
MTDSRIDWRKPGRNYIDPEFENLFASSLIEVKRPHHYVHVAYEIGVAGIIAGALLLLLSVFGSMSWTPVMAFMDGRSLITTGVLGALMTLVGALTALAAGLWLRYGP